MRIKEKHLILHGLIWVSLLFTGCHTEREGRQQEVAMRGEHVMPFDLDRSTHVFEKSIEGGKQTIVSDDNDPDQIVLIQHHLAEIAAAFSRGDFSGPAFIHGSEMAGLQMLADHYEQLTIEYASLAKGGMITYTTNNDSVKEALHIWFDAQVTDHGDHARHRH